jgi:hypothetical protein
VTFAAGERVTSVSALFSVSCVVRGAAFRLLVVVGFTYSPVNPLLLLTGHGIGICSRSSFKEEFIVTELFHRINATL